MDKSLTIQLIKNLKEFSDRNRVADFFDENDFVSTFEQLSPYVTMVNIEFKNFEFIRSRRTQRGVDFEHVKQIGYPPAHQIKTAGRCNFAEQSILYGSSNVETSFLEIEFNADEPCAVMAQFRLKEGASLVLQPMGELDHYRRHKRPRIESVGLIDQLKEIENRLDHYDQMTHFFVDAYLADFFSRIPNEHNQKNLYEVTSRIANTFINASNIDGLIYPSVRHVGGLNYAIKPNVFDERFEIVKYALTAPVYEHGYGLFEYFVHAQGNYLDDQGRFLFKTNPQFNARTTWPLSADQ